MSVNLYWRPRPKAEGVLGDGLKHALRRGNPSLNESPVTFDADCLPYLEGIRDGGIEDARELIALIEKYGEVEVWIAE